MACIPCLSVLIFLSCMSLQCPEQAGRTYLLPLWPGRRYQDSGLSLLSPDVPDSARSHGTWQVLSGREVSSGLPSPALQPSVLQRKSEIRQKSGGKEFWI